MGDTPGNATSEPDITSYALTATESHVSISIELAGPTFDPSSDNDALFGFIDLDLDGDETTGAVPLLERLGFTATGLGAELAIEALQVLAWAAAMALELLPLRATAHTPTLYRAADSPAGAGGRSCGAFFGPAAGGHETAGGIPVGRRHPRD